MDINIMRASSFGVNDEDFFAPGISNGIPKSEREISAQMVTKMYKKKTRAPFFQFLKTRAPQALLKFHDDNFLII
jgi:hypothetical protein